MRQVKWFSPSKESNWTIIWATNYEGITSIRGWEPLLSIRKEEASNILPPLPTTMSTLKWPPLHKESSSSSIKTGTTHNMLQRNFRGGGIYGLDTLCINSNNDDDTDTTPKISTLHYTSSAAPMATAVANEYTIPNHHRYTANLDRT